MGRQTFCHYAARWVASRRGVNGDRALSALAREKGAAAWLGGLLFSMTSVALGSDDWLSALVSSCVTGGAKERRDSGCKQRGQFA